MAHRGATPEERPGVSPQQLEAVAEAAENTERKPELEKGLDDLTAQAADAKFAQSHGISGELTRLK